MRLTSSVGMILLAIWLILMGLPMLVASVAVPPVVMGILALLAGLMILVGR